MGQTFQAFGSEKTLLFRTVFELNHFCLTDSRIIPRPSDNPVGRGTCLRSSAADDSDVRIEALRIGRESQSRRSAKETTQRGACFGRDFRSDR